MLRSIAFGAVFLLFLVSGGCVTPAKDNRTTAENFAENSADQVYLVIGVPVVKQNPLQRKFAGTVYCGEGLSRIILRQAEVKLVSDSKIIASQFSDDKGRYLLSSVILPEKKYSIHVKGSCGERAIPLVDSDLLGTELDVSLLPP